MGHTCPKQLFSFIQHYSHLTGRLIFPLETYRAHSPCTRPSTRVASLNPGPLVGLRPLIGRGAPAPRAAGVTQPRQPGPRRRRRGHRLLRSPGWRKCGARGGRGRAEREAGGGPPVAGRD